MPKKRILIFSIAGALALAFLYTILAVEIPAVKARIIVFAAWLAAEIYCWLVASHLFSLFKSFKKKSKKRKIGEILFTSVYWLPFLLVLISMVIVATVGIKDMDTTSYSTVVGYSAILYLIKFIITGLLVAWQIIIRIVKLKNRHLNIEKSTRRFLRVAIGFFVFAFAMMLFGTFYGATNFIVTTTILHTDKQVFKEKPLKIVLISDLHLSTWRNPNHLAEALEIVNAQNPDMILVTGDMVQFEGSEIVPYMQMLKTLKAPMGIYSVLGNHDYGRYARFASEEERKENVRTLIENQESLGWKMLCNENITLQYFDSTFITILGIENWSPDAMFVNDADIDKTMKGIDANHYNILLSHNPQIWRNEILPHYPVHLTVGGHTHGMQLGIYTEKFRLSPSSLLYKEWGGLYEDEQYKEKKLYVNVGLGSVGFPIRVGVYPEISVIEVK